MVEEIRDHEDPTRPDPDPTGMFGPHTSMCHPAPPQRAGEQDDMIHAPILWRAGW
jgi:hypothetical protein